MIRINKTGFRHLFLASMSVSFGLAAGATVMVALWKLMTRYVPSPVIHLTVSRPAVALWIHAIVGLSAFAAGVASGWMESRDDPKGPQRRRLGGAYGFGVASTWLILLTCVLWHVMVWVWPVFLLDFLLVALATMLGQRMSGRP